MDRLKTMRVSEAEVIALAATPAADSTAPLQLGAQADYELQRLDSKLLRYLQAVAGAEAAAGAEAEAEWPQPESHAERQLLKLAQQAADHNLTSAYVLACIGIHRGLYEQAFALLSDLMRDPVLQRDALLQLNVQFQLGVLLYDNLCEGDQQEQEQKGLEMMIEVASNDPSKFEAKGPVDQPPEELNDAAEVIGSAQFNVGRAYYEGVGVEQNDDIALDWWKKAAAEGLITGSNQAQNALGIYYSQRRRLDPSDPLKVREPDWSESFSWHKAAATNGNVDSQCRLGLLYRDGKGTRSDTQEALMWLKKAAMAGHDIAETELAAHYYKMRLFNKAVQWAMLVCEPIEEATDASIRELPDDLRTARASACWHLSRCYERGVGVEEKSAAQAERYRRLAMRHDLDTVASLQRRVVSMEIA